MVGIHFHRFVMRSVIPPTLALACVALLLSLTVCSDADVPATVTTPPATENKSGLPEVDPALRVPVSYDTLLNDEAPIPPQCYTKTDGRFNPCYTCHQSHPEDGDYHINKRDDGALQGVYLFSEVGEANHWENLFADKSAYVDQISDAAIRNYIATDNYSDLADRLIRNGWQGWIPDLEDYENSAAAFDAEGIARDGSAWVAFNYKPFPSTFWPTNGSTDDVTIRLPTAFREIAGAYSRDVYLANLSLLEMAIKDLDSITTPPLDEAAIGADIDGDGMMRRGLTQIQRRATYFGDAAAIPVTPQQFPAGTQFMHSVRYLDETPEGDIVVSRRMKELRYMEKIAVLSDGSIRNRYARERKEKLDGQFPRFINHGDAGFENGFGWLVQGFIEDYDGALRPQTYEEQMFCMGCHAGIGTTIDHTFSFGRKVTGAEGWGYIDLKGMPDSPSISGGEGEILEYLRRAGGGNEFRENPEMRERWFLDDNQVREDAVRNADVYTLLTPSPQRARALNKAYTWIVRHQSYIYGRDANVLPAANVHSRIDAQSTPLQSEYRFSPWDSRLDWNAIDDSTEE